MLSNLPNLFPQLYSKDFNFECREGWYNLLFSLSERLVVLFAEIPQENHLDFKVLQVKQKFGTLRFYCSDNNYAISAAIRRAERDSSLICEECGEPGLCQRNVLGWWFTACKKHALPLVAS